MHVRLDLCTIVDVSVVFSEFSIGGHVSAQGAETLTWVIFKNWFYNREALTGFLFYRPLMWTSRSLIVLIGSVFYFSLLSILDRVFLGFHRLRRKPLATVEV